jgi:hypothetical protein
LIRELSVVFTPDCGQALSICANGDPDPQVRAAAIDALQAQAALAQAQATAPTTGGS